MRLLVSGSSGLIGKALTQLLKINGHDVVCLIRSGKKKSSEEISISWDPIHGHINKDLFEGFDAIFHLAGENIAKGRWTKKRKEKLFVSRCRDTWLLSQILVRLHRPPKTMICASAIGFYGDRGTELLSETSLKGKGFLSDLCEKWEEGTLPIENRGCRVVHARFGTVLSLQGGFFKRVLPFFRLGLGGTIGSGKQIISWIDLEDAIQALYFLLCHHELSGPFNIVAPFAVTQKEFTQALAKSVHRPALLPMPKIVVNFLFGEMGKELLLSSTHAIPSRLQEAHFKFLYPTLEESLTHLLGKP